MGANGVQLSGGEDGGGYVGYAYGLGDVARRGFAVTGEHGYFKAHILQGLDGGARGGLDGIVDIEDAGGAVVDGGGDGGFFGTAEPGGAAGLYFVAIDGAGCD